jgi:voltage-gated potassium channel
LFHISRFKKIIIAVSLLLLIVCAGVVGFLSIEEGFTLLDAFYMTIITISTTGFAEVQHLSDTGRIFTAFLIITSFGTFAYAISVITSYIVDGEFKLYFKDMKVQQEITKLSGHVIVCGFGRNGSQSAHVLHSEKTKFVVVESSEEAFRQIKETYPNYLVILGDATQDDTLIRAGIKNARALITSLPIDSANLFVVLSSRVLNPKLKIITRASDDGSDKKLRRAGADNVIMPDKIGGGHMASLVTKPDIVEFWDFISAKDNMHINLEEIKFDELPESFKGKTIQDLDIRNLCGANIIGYKTMNGEYIINPAPNTLLSSGSKLFALGDNQQISKLKRLLNIKH